MNLIRFTTTGSPNPYFGVVIREQAVPFVVLQSKAGKSYSHLTNSRSYLANLPESEEAAKELLAWGEQHLGELGGEERFPLNAIRLLEPVEVSALFDFGLTPRHLKNSAETIMKYEKDNPQTAPLLQAFAKAIVSPPTKSAAQPEPLAGARTVAEVPRVVPHSPRPATAARNRAGGGSSCGENRRSGC
jgi:hypothetical protein